MVHRVEEELIVPETDRQVVEAVRGGDREAYRTLVVRHQDKLLGVLIQLTGDRLLAEELAQETFVKAYTRLDGFRGESRFSTWLIQIGIHTVRDHRRWSHRRGRDRVISLDEVRGERARAMEVPDRRPVSDPARILEGREGEELVRQAVADLPPEHREVLVLKHFEGWSYDRIAELTGDTVGSLKVRAHRARRLLRERMSELGWEPSADDGVPAR